MMASNDSSEVSAESGKQCATVAERWRDDQEEVAVVEREIGGSVLDGRKDVGRREGADLCTCWAWPKTRWRRKGMQRSEGRTRKSVWCW